MVDPGCDMIRRGFNGRYQFKRLQVVGRNDTETFPTRTTSPTLHDALQYAAFTAS
jgi:hypothetical protein